ncbi:hypothetical protein U0070_012761 [Myodes glareolus]|uniref:Uncharacterized protein n=1 Tax=Myodes glareolus TaxID=447135 RepID=A0AAW0HCC2_MYOGA
MARESCVAEAGSAAAALFCWGANSYGQLGLGHKEDVLLPQQLSNFCEPGCIRSVTGGGGHSAAVTDSSGECVGKGREEKGPEHHSVQNFLAGDMGSGKHEEGVSHFLDL